MTEPAQLELPLPVPEAIPVPEATESPRPSQPPSREVARVMQRWEATEIFDEFWRFAARRQAILMRRLAGLPPPWTTDPILQRYRFTNPYRLSDRVSQYLIRNVQYDRPRPGAAMVFRTLLFKVFNRIDTWESLAAEVGELTIETFDLHHYSSVLNSLKAEGRRIYSPAYIVPNPPFCGATKHDNHLRMLAAMLDDGTIDKLAAAKNLAELYQVMRAVPSLGPFLAFQYAIDINYSDVTACGEDGFVVAGPGAREGLSKCFTALPATQHEEAIRWVTQTQHAHFKRLGLQFETISDRPLQPIDCQNLFCEINKYTRASHPHVAGPAGRTRIKQTFDTTNRAPLPPIFIPPKWQAAPVPTLCSGRPQPESAEQSNQVMSNA